MHAEWNWLGHAVNSAKSQLARGGLRLDADLAFFDQYANRVISGKQNVGDFAWRALGDWRLFDLEDSRHVWWLGRGFVGFTTFGTIGFGDDVADESLTGNVGALNTLQAATFGVEAVVDEFYWKQVAMDGRLVLFGAIARVGLPRNAYVMLGFADSSVSGAGRAWKVDAPDSFYELLEIGIAIETPALGPGHYRLTPWHNRLEGESGFGVALHVDQTLGHSDLIAFFRFGHGDPDVTPVTGFVSGGVAYQGPFGRDADRAALGVAWAAPGKGAGERSETVLELAYTIEVFKALTLTPDLQLVFRPTNNPDADLVVVPGVRLLMEF